jgi:hypothetical protein
MFNNFKHLDNFVYVDDIRWIHRASLLAGLYVVRHQRWRSRCFKHDVLRHGKDGPNWQDVFRHPVLKTSCPSRAVT